MAHVFERDGQHYVREDGRTYRYFGNGKRSVISEETIAEVEASEARASSEAAIDRAFPLATADNRERISDLMGMTDMAAEEVAALVRQLWRALA